MDNSGFFNSFHRNTRGELKSSFFDPFEVKHRKRTSKSQLKILEKTFESNKKPDSALRNQLSEQLGMTPRSVQVWFQNRRAKQKKSKIQNNESTNSINNQNIKYENANENFNAIRNDMHRFQQNYNYSGNNHISNNNISNNNIDNINMSGNMNNIDNNNIDINNINNNNLNMDMFNDDNFFRPIQLPEKSTFLNDRFPQSPLQNYPLKKINSVNNIQNNLFYPKVDELDSSWIDMEKNYEQDENLSENTICFDPDNFFC